MKSLLDIALEEVTAPFEGGGYDNVSPNFDGMGLSAGILQWCYGQGSLQNKVLLPFLNRHGSIDNLKIFPGKVDITAKMDAVVSVKYSSITMHSIRGLLKKRYVLKPEWEEAWKEFLTLPQVIQIQKESCESLDFQAKYMCYKWGLKSTISYCWMFDILTQNGSLLGLQKPTPRIENLQNFVTFADSPNKKLWSGIDPLKLTSEQVTLFIASRLRALKSRKEYQNDVFSRKGTIAMGLGIVHGEKFDLQRIPLIETSDSVV